MYFYHRERHSYLNFRMVTWSRTKNKFFIFKLFKTSFKGVYKRSAVVIRGIETLYSTLFKEQ